MKIGILWDLDGTLLDTLQDLTDSVNHVLTELGYPKRSFKEIRCFLGNGIRRLMEQAIPAGAPLEPAVAMIQSYYAAHCQIKTAAYPGILDALESLREYPMAIVSNKPDRAVKILCGDYFPGIYARGESADCPRKPAPDMVHKTMEDLGIDGCIYVGDSEVDIETAKNAGVPCLSVTWGFRDKSELSAAGATHFCDDPGELKEKLEEMMNSYGK